MQYGKHANMPYTSPRKEKHTSMQHLLLEVLISIAWVRRRSFIPPHCQSPRYVSRTDYHLFKTKAKDSYFLLIWNVWGIEVRHDSIANLRTSERWIDLPWFLITPEEIERYYGFSLTPRGRKCGRRQTPPMSVPWVLCPRLMLARCRLDKINSRFEAGVNNK